MAVEKIREALKAAAMLRGSKPDQPTLTLYSGRLAKEDERDVMAALEMLAETRREQYDPALPEIGELLAMIKVCALARENREKAALSQRLVRWQCVDCKVTCCAFPSSGESLDRRCHGLPRDGSTATDKTGKRICGGRMEVIFDESQEKDEEPVSWDDRGVMQRLSQKVQL